MASSHDLPDLLHILRGALPSFFKQQTRFGKLGPAQVFYLLVKMCSLGQSGYRRVLVGLPGRQAWRLGWRILGRPSAAAMCKARKHLTIAQCREAHDAVLRACSFARKRPEFRYDQRHLYALDGSGLSLPRSAPLLEHFGGPENQHGSTGTPGAHMVMLWNVSTQQPIDFDLSPHRHSEVSQALTLVDAVPSSGILLADRGFYSFAFVSEIVEKQLDFLIRVSRTACQAVQDFADHLMDDQVVTIAPPSNLSKTQREALPYLRVRLIRVPLSHGGTGIFMTSLQKKDGHTLRRLQKLYTTRWRIETAFDEMKNWHAMQCFSAKHVAGIHQEIWAAFVFQLLVAELEARARKEVFDFKKARRQAGRPATEPLPGYRFNRRLIADAVDQLMTVAIHRPQELAEELKDKIYQLYRYRTKRRPGRSYEREVKSPRPGYKSRSRK